ncbi:MAG: hypothetical protein Q7K57_00730 [Burkholderiaceae bacterium]|nr:hypothetical protein [Polaromonas sp.]MDO8767241.1 hypothetical protein [Burkholderiaceae bacterium]
MNSFGIFHLLILLVIGGILFGVYLYAKTYKSLLEAIGPKYIAIHPNLPFLIFVPVVGVIFYVILAFSLKTALARLHQEGRISIKTDAVSKSMLAFCACMVLTVIPLVSQFMMLAALICLGFNWSHAVNTRKLVLMGGAN